MMARCQNASRVNDSHKASARYDTDVNCYDDEWRKRRLIEQPRAPALKRNWLGRVFLERKRNWYRRSAQRATTLLCQAAKKWKRKWKWVIKRKDKNGNGCKRAMVCSRKNESRAKRERNGRFGKLNPRDTRYIRENFYHRFIRSSEFFSPW